MCNLKIYPMQEKKVISAAKSVFDIEYEVKNSLRDATNLGIPRRLTGV